VGKHAAPDGAATDPIVSDALAQRLGQIRPAPSAGPTGEGVPGWPGPPPPEDPGGLGWPGDLKEADAHAPQTSAARRGWRRFFGSSRVA
jgi:hypothetical protein